MTISDIITALVAASFIGAALVYAFHDEGWFRGHHWSKTAFVFIAASLVLGAVFDHLVLPFTREISTELWRNLLLAVFVSPFVVLWGVPMLGSAVTLCLLLPAWILRWLGFPSFLAWLIGTAKKAVNLYERMGVAGFCWLLILVGIGGSLVAYRVTVLLPARWLLGLVST